MYQRQSRVVFTPGLLTFPSAAHSRALLYSVWCSHSSHCSQAQCWPPGCSFPVPSEWRLDFAGPPNLITEPAGKTEWKTTPSTTAHPRESQESDIGVATSHKKVAFSVLGMRAQKPMWVHHLSWPESRTQADPGAYGKGCHKCRQVFKPSWMDILHTKEPACN